MASKQALTDTTDQRCVTRLRVASPRHVVLDELEIGCTAARHFDTAVSVYQVQVLHFHLEKACLFSQNKRSRQMVCVRYLVQHSLQSRRRMKQITCTPQRCQSAAKLQVYTGCQQWQGEPSCGECQKQAHLLLQMTKRHHVYLHRSCIASVSTAGS